MAALLYLVFVLSGAAGLVYETTWSRYLGLFVGHGAYAQVIVLVIFLGGMSLGAWLVGERSEQLTRPLRWYVAAELLVAIIGVAFHDAFTAVTGLAYDALFPALGAGVLLTVAKWTIAALLILPQSVLLGTTFPLMSAGVLRATRAAPAASGRVLAMLYFTNSLGAAAGGLLAGFWLVELAGLPGTLYAAAALNVIAAGLVAVVGRRAEGEAPVTAGEALDASHANVDAAADATDDAPAAPARLVRALLWVAGGTALASFIYEIAWIRMLALVLGAATHSFELMLSAFILGLALGSLWVRRRADRFADPVQALGRVQVAMGLLAVGTLPLYLQSFHGQAWLLGALGPGPEGYVVFTSAKYAIALAVMLPATFCAGITLPLITRTLLAAGAGERAIGQVYAVNTLGSIAGAALAALVLLPLLGLKGLLVTGALIDAGLGVWLLAGAADAWRPRRAWAPLAAGAALAIAAVATLSRFDRLLLTSGVYRYGMAELAPSWHSVFYADGRTATVSARLDSLTGEVSLATNGKPDASLPRQWMLPVAGAAASIAGDQSAQFLLPLVTLAYHPKARHVATIGHGSGMSSHVLLGSPLLEDLTTIEIEPQMIEGSKAFLPANRRVFEDPRSHFRIDDARSVFAAGGVQYDLILSEPSNPWVSGVSGLFTDEFYQRTRRALAPRGILGQWLHLYEMNDLLVLSVLAAVHRNFPSYAIHLVSPSDILIVASNERTLPAADFSVVSLPRIEEDMRRVLPLTPDALAATWLADRASLAPLLDRWRAVNSDFYPYLDLGTERARFLKGGAVGFNGLATDRFSILHALAGRPSLPNYETRPSMLIGRVEQMAHAAALRAAIVGQLTPQEIGRSPQVAGLLFAWRGLDALARANQPPGDWRAWLAKVQDVEDGIDGGLAGSIDSSFYAMIEGYLQRQAAPPPVRTAVGYMKALSSWNWPAAAATSDSLLLLDRRGQRWMGAEILRAGGVVAHLKVGDVPGARRFMDVLTPQLKLALTDVRTLILDSWVREAEGERP
jgi:predicted membrane-bound spermidine synthase